MKGTGGKGKMRKRGQLNRLENETERRVNLYLANNSKFYH